MVFMNQRNHLRVSPHGALEREGVGKRVLEKAWSGLLFFFMNKMLVFQAFA
ncbi:hypothetical protein [Bartonella sp. AP58NXGY]|uniref:hypothetical protein n=1 Tax=Bartonella sp. AP58NXGY TaxID=3243498 RepID=UPI0035CFDC77